jgi:hypothetical protein
VNTFSFRTIVATALVAATALSGCGGSDSSNVKTRNSSINDPCIGVYPSVGDSVVTAAITNPDCATSLVDVSPRHYQPAINTSNTDPYADRRDPSATQMDYNHEFQQFVIAHEARDANNVPIEYVQTTGDGKDIATNVYKRSKIVPIPSSNQNTACVQPLLASDRKTPAIGFGDNKSSDCKEVDSYQVTLYVGGNGNQRILYELATWASYAFEIADNNFPVGLGYYAVVGMVNGYPHTKMVITRPSVDSVNVAHYRYLEPTRQFQYSEGDTSSTSSSSSTTAAPDTTISTLPVENSTPTEDSSTSSSSSTVVTDVDNTSTDSDNSAGTNLRNIIDACRKLEGVETSPATDEWNEGEQFTIRVSNDCITPANITGFIDYSFSHTLTAVHQKTNEYVYLHSYRDKEAAHFIGRLYPGDWTLTLRQNVSAQIVDGQEEDLSTAMVIEANIKENNKNPLIPCTANDLELNGNKLALNCGYSDASLEYLANNGLYTRHWFPQNRLQTEVLDARPGWSYATLFTDSSGYEQSLTLLICTASCDQSMSEVQADYARVSPEMISVKQTNSQCVDPQNNYLLVIPFTSVNKQLMQLTPNVDKENIGSFDITNTALISHQLETDFLYVFQYPDRDRTDCKFRSNWGLESLISLGNLPKSKNEPTAEPTQVSPPTRIDEIEISRTDTVGSPVVISQEQTLIYIPVSALPDLTTADGKVIATASVLNAEDEWVPLLPHLPNNVRIAAGAKELKVKYTFSDGTEAVVTKKVITPSEDQQILEKSSPSSSTSLPLILAVLALLVLGSSIVVIRKRK